MTANVLTQEFVFAALEAERDGEQFPVDLDDVWQSLGYSSKDSAKQALIRMFVKEKDWIKSHKKPSTGGRPKIAFMLTQETYIQLGEINTIRTKPKATEKNYSNKLSKKHKGKREVVTLAGKIDVLTSHEIIEVKHVADWKAGIGQILVYGHYYPSHQKRIHLYGETQQSYLDMVKFHCEKLNIRLTWES